jgi:hypothetical protein
VVSDNYTITLAANDAPPTFKFTATPILGSKQAADVTLTIDNAGSKTPGDKW